MSRVIYSVCTNPMPTLMQNMVISKFMNQNQNHIIWNGIWNGMYEIFAALFILEHIQFADVWLIKISWKLFSFYFKFMDKVLIFVIP